jgi:hypothetical protein
VEACYQCRDGNHAACVGISCQCPCPVATENDTAIEDIQRRCRAAAERFEALAGPARVDVVVSADLLLEAASLLRGYHQCLLVQEVLGPSDAEVNTAIDLLAEKAKRSVRGTSGHAYGREAEIQRQADALKAVLNNKSEAERRA